MISRVLPTMLRASSTHLAIATCPWLRSSFRYKCRVRPTGFRPNGGSSRRAVWVNARSNRKKRLVDDEEESTRRISKQRSPKKPSRSGTPSSSTLEATLETVEMTALLAALGMQGYDLYQNTRQTTTVQVGILQSYLAHILLFVPAPVSCSC